MYFYSFCDAGFEKRILLDFHTPHGLLPPEYIGKSFKSLNTINVKSNLYRIAGNDADKSLMIGFGRGSIDDYAVLVVLCVQNQKYAYFPLDSDWLETFDAILQLMIRERPDFGYLQVCDMMKQVLSQLMELAVCRKEVFETDFSVIESMLESWSRYFSSEIYWSMFYWSVWFFYACVAEERYERNGRHTIVGGLMKLVAWLEHVYEGWSVQDACYHYRADCYCSRYGGSGRASVAVIDKCKSYGIERKPVW